MTVEWIYDRLMQPNKPVSPAKEDADARAVCYLRSARHGLGLRARSGGAARRPRGRRVGRRGKGGRALRVPPDSAVRESGPLRQHVL